MKQYLKMVDYFVGGVSARFNNYGDVVVDYDCADPDMIVKKTMIAIEHAINSHDELVRMNQELLAALEALFHETNQQNLSVADKVIAKAKGGAA